MIKNSSGRLMALMIITTWLVIAVVRAVDSIDPEIIDIPYGWAAAAVMFYFMRNMSAEVLQAIVMRFLGMKPEPKGPSA